MKKALAFIFLLSFCAIGYSEDTQMGNVYVLDDWSKGLNNKLSPYSLPKSQGDIVENARFSPTLKALSKRDQLYLFGTADALEPITGMHRYYKSDGTKAMLVSHGDEIEVGSDSAGTFSNILNLSTANHKWQFITWHDIAIGCDGYNQPIKWDGSSSSATYLGSCLAADAGSGAGPNGTYTYKVSFYTTSYEVLFNVPSNSVTVVDNDITLTMIPIGPTTYGGETVTGRKIYRITNGGTTYKLLTNGTIADNTTVTITDSDADGALGASYPAGTATWAPPKGRFALIHQNRLFFANDPTNNPSRVWYSEDGSHELFQSASYLDIRKNDGDSITFIKNLLGLLTIGKNNTIQKIYTKGSTPSSDWSISDPFSFVGCQAPYSAVNSPLGIIYLASDGIYRFSGQSSELISEAVTPTIKDISPSDLENCWGIYHENLYYLSYLSEESQGQTNNRVLVLDVLSNAYSVDINNINSFCAFNSGTDFGILYCGASDSGKVYGFDEESTAVIHRRWSDFTGLWDDMRYLPTVADGDSESPVLEISRTETINELVWPINSVRGTIDRQDYQGHYVSQVMVIGNSILDKLYWNYVTKAPGDSVSFQLRSSATGESNLLLNDDFNFWDNYAWDSPSTVRPNDWEYKQTGTTGSVASDTTTTKRGTMASKLTKSSTGTSILLQRVSATPYQGKPMIFNGWVKSANSVAGDVYISIGDFCGADTTFPYANSGNYEHLATGRTINATATSVTVSYVINADADAVAYCDQPMLIQGTSATNDWTAWGDELTLSTGSDLSSQTKNTYMQYLVNATTSTLSTSPNLTKADGYVVKIAYNKGGTKQSDAINLHWRSGWMDFGQPSRRKSLKYIYVYHSGTSGTLNIKFENEYGDTDTFPIDLAVYPSLYKEAFTSGKMVGQNFRVEITNNDANALRIDRIVVIYDTEPLGNQ